MQSSCVHTCPSSFMSVEFYGKALVDRLEAEQKKTVVREVAKVLPAPKEKGDETRSVRHFDDHYGFRGENPNVHYLSPWEFLRHWEVVEISASKLAVSEAASVGATLRADSPKGKRMRSEKDATPLEDGDGAEDRFPFMESDDLIRYPELEGGVDLRKRWYMRRRKTPMVPSPAHSPMPDKQGSQEGKARILSVYLRPWVLDSRHASMHVPHLVDLDRIPCRRTSNTTAARRRLRDTQQQTQGRGHMVTEDSGGTQG